MLGEKIGRMGYKILGRVKIRVRFINRCFRCPVDEFPRWLASTKSSLCPEN